MFRKTLIALPVVAGLAMAACTPAGVALDPTTAQVINAGQLAAFGLCAITPTAETITDLVIAAKGSQKAADLSTLAKAAADAFCKGVLATATPARAVKKAPHKASHKALKAAPKAAPRKLTPTTYGTVTVNGKTVVLQGFGK